MHLLQYDAAQSVFLAAFTVEVANLDVSRGVFNHFLVRVALARTVAFFQRPTRWDRSATCSDFHLRLIALTSAKRVGAYPDAPVVSELIPDFKAGSWQGVLTTVGTPRETVAKINADIVKVLNTPEMKERITGFGADVIANSPEQMDAFLRGDRDRWAKVIRDSGLKIEQ